MCAVTSASFVLCVTIGDVFYLMAPFHLTLPMRILHYAKTQTCSIYDLIQLGS